MGAAGSRQHARHTPTQQGHVQIAVGNNAPPLQISRWRAAILSAHSGSFWIHLQDLLQSGRMATVCSCVCWCEAALGVCNRCCRGRGEVYEQLRQDACPASAAK